MQFRLDVYHHFSPCVTDDHLAQIEQKLDLVIERTNAMANEIERLTAAIDRNTSVDQSIIALVDGLAEQLRDMADSATELNAFKSSVNEMAARLEDDNQKVVDAVKAHTPMEENNPEGEEEVPPVQ